MIKIVLWPWSITLTFQLMQYCSSFWPCRPNEWHKAHPQARLNPACKGWALRFLSPALHGLDWPLDTRIVPRTGSACQDQALRLCPLGLDSDSPHHSLHSLAYQDWVPSLSGVLGSGPGVLCCPLLVLHTRIRPHRTHWTLGSGPGDWWHLWPGQCPKTRAHAILCAWSGVQNPGLPTSLDIWQQRNSARVVVWPFID